MRRDASVAPMASVLRVALQIIYFFDWKNYACLFVVIVNFITYLDWEKGRKKRSVLPGRARSNCDQPLVTETRARGLVEQEWKTAVNHSHNQVHNVNTNRRK